MEDKSLAISRFDLYAMERHVNYLAPQEGCGLLGGKERVVTLVLPVKNAAESPVRFTMEPRAQLRAIERIELEGLEMLAIFHSHPKGPSAPSPTDIREAAWPVVNIIWSKVGRRWQARAFWIEDGRAEEVALNVTDL